MTRRSLAAAALLAALAAAPPAAPPATAHPHVFVDAGLGFVFGADGTLEALEITWRLDPFETLYTLSSEGLALNEEGGLDQAAQDHLAAQFMQWPADFDGFAKLSVGGVATRMAAPEALRVEVVEGHLQVSFTRRLEAPAVLDGASAEVAAYEATYYYAVTMPELPVLRGAAAGCSARAIPFEPDTDLTTLQTSLFDLGREETPGIANVGALFADRVVVTCD
ncbi:MAG: DUF1007 family protein [Pseudomonadota bacterium]